MVAAEADPAGILWTHPNGIGFRSGVYGLGLNAHIPTGGYPHSHGLLVKREAEAEPHGYYGYGRVFEKMSVMYGNTGTDKRTDVWSQPLCIYTQIFSPKKTWFFPHRKYSPIFF
jgi:hypothetical protein